MSVIDVMSGDLNFFLAFNGSDKQERENVPLSPCFFLFRPPKRWLDGNLRAIAPLLRGGSAVQAVYGFLNPLLHKRFYTKKSIYFSVHYTVLFAAIKMLKFGKSHFGKL